jgi:hypothetical protein
MGFVVLTIGMAGMTSAYSTFWSLPTALLSGGAASAGIAWINSVGNLAGYVSPYLIGKVRDVTHSMTPALLAISFCCFAAALLTIFFFSPSRTNPRIERL